jgi:hypothetical protein
LPTGQARPGCIAYFLQGLSDDEALELWRTLKVKGGSRAELVPIFRSVEGHPLLLQALASEVANYPDAPGDFPKWLADHPQFDPVSVPLMQSRTHVLEFALRGLSAKVREVLQMLVTFRMPASYATLEALLVGPDKPCRSAQELDRALTEIEARGLIGWDRKANRYEAHPIVHGSVWVLTDPKDRQAQSAAVADHFKLRRELLVDEALPERQDPDPLLVRLTAATSNPSSLRSALERVTSSDSATRSVLLKVIEHRDDTTRCLILRKLVELWPDTQTQNLLVTKLNSEVSGDVRALSGQLLGQLWWKKANIRDLLRSQARADPEEDARQRLDLAATHAARKVSNFWERMVSGDPPQGEEGPEMLPGYPAFRLAQFRLKNIGPVRDSGVVDISRGVNIFLGDKRRERQLY